MSSSVVNSALIAYIEARAGADKYDMNDRVQMDGEALRAIQLDLREKSRALLSAIAEERESWVKGG